MNAAEFERETAKHAALAGSMPPDLPRPRPGPGSPGYQVLEPLKPDTGRPCDACLYALLAIGPRNSRDVQVWLRALQFTPKQVRLARERLGVVIERAGNGRAMHSTWRLPSDGATADATPVAATIDNATVPPTDATPEAPVSREAKVGEQLRHHARVQAFMAMGHDADTARAVADALVGRDRAGRPAAGSCAECQNIALRQCQATPRPATEIHECWSRRQCTP